MASMEVASSAENRKAKLLNLTKIETRTPSHLLSNNGLCLCSMRSTCYYFLVLHGSSYILPDFTFTELHALTLATCSYVLLHEVQVTYAFQ